jgi:adenylylsulfate kinase
MSYLNGEIKEFTGISSPYDEPSWCDIRINTKEDTIEECVEYLVREVKVR